MIDVAGVENFQLDGIDKKDYPDFCDAYIAAADWKDSGNELTDDELEELNEDSGFVYELVIDHLY